MANISNMIGKAKRAEEKEAAAREAEKEAKRAEKAQAHLEAVERCQLAAGRLGIRIQNLTVDKTDEISIQKIDRLTDNFNRAAQLLDGEDNVHRAETAELQRTLDEAENRATQAGKARDEAQAQLESAKAGQEELRKERDHLQEELEKARETVKDLREQLAQAQAEPSPLSEPEPAADESENEAEEEGSLPEGTFDGDEPLTNADRAVNGTNGDEPSLWQRFKDRNRDREERNRAHESRPKPRITLSREQVGS